jgi:polyisoprenoid-binding protein YceI
MTQTHLPAPAVVRGTYDIDSQRSAVRFLAVHAFGLGKVAGTFTIRHGRITIAEEPMRSTVDVIIDAASFRTDKPKRDADVTSKRFMNVAAFAEIRFRSTALVRTADGWRVDGELTVHGVPAPVSLVLSSATTTGGGCRFTATGRVDRYAHGVTSGKGLIGRYLDVDLDIHSTA